MILCSNCGQENPDAARFCFACGNAFDAAAEGSRDERRFVSVVFVDLVGFTGRAERLDPEDVRAVLSPYHDLVRNELESFGGVVEKFIGDAIMAVFGAPTAYGDDSERAVRAALAVRDAVREADERDLHLDLQLRIAVNTGEALVALGARPALGEAMVAGDVVNTASRLQQAAPVNGVIVGAETYAATRDAIEYEPAPAVEAKGKSKPVEAWIALTPLHPAGVRQLSGDLVGRGRELDLLRGVWERVAGERVPHLVTVLGPAGIGKTRLAQEFGEIVEGLGGRSVRGRSLPYRESSAYFGFSMQVKQLCGIFESDLPEVGLKKLRERVGDVPGSDAETVTRHLAILLGLDREGSVDDREELFFSVRVFIEAVAADRPTVLVFEDIHWADRSLLDLIELLAARLRDLPVFILALARPELLDARPAWGGGLPAYTALPLAPLNADESRELAAHRLADIPADDMARLAETAEGNPLFIEQLAATIAEASASRSQRCRRPSAGSSPRASTRCRPRSARSCSTRRSSAGRSGAARSSESQGPPTASLSYSAPSRARDLIARETASIMEGEQQFSFKHVLIREVAYELLPRADRQERHARVAEFFEASTAEVGEAVAALARHWRDAGSPERAIRYFIEAGEQAERGWAKDQAVILYGEALELVPEGDNEQLVQLRRRLGLAVAAAIHIPDARQLMQEG